MRAKKVIDFEEDMDPYKALKIGSHQVLEINDRFEVINDMYMLRDWTWVNSKPTSAAAKPLVKKNSLIKGEIIVLMDIEVRSEYDLSTSYIFNPEKPSLDFYYINEEDLHLVKKIN